MVRWQKKAINMLDRLHGFDAKVIGRDNAKDGADRQISDIFIQTKYPAETSPTNLSEPEQRLSRADLSMPRLLREALWSSNASSSKLSVAPIFPQSLQGL